MLSDVSLSHRKPRLQPRIELVELIIKRSLESGHFVCACRWLNIVSLLQWTLQKVCNDLGPIILEYFHFFPRSLMSYAALIVLNFPLLLLLFQLGSENRLVHIEIELSESLHRRLNNFLLFHLMNSHSWISRIESALSHRLIQLSIYFWLLRINEAVHPLNSLRWRSWFFVKTSRRIVNYKFIFTPRAKFRNQQILSTFLLIFLHSKLIYQISFWVIITLGGLNFDTVSIEGCLGCNHSERPVISFRLFLLTRRIIIGTCDHLLSIIEQCIVLGNSLVFVNLAIA